MSRDTVIRALHSLVEKQMTQFYETPEHLQSLRVYRNLTELKVQEAVLYGIIRNAESTIPDEPTARRNFLNGVLENLPGTPAIRELALESGSKAWTATVTRKESFLDSDLEVALKDWISGQTSSEEFVNGMHLLDRKKNNDMESKGRDVDTETQRLVTIQQALFDAQQAVNTAAAMFCDHKPIEDPATRQVVSQSLLQQILDSPGRSL